MATFLVEIDDQDGRVVNVFHPPKSAKEGSLSAVKPGKCPHAVEKISGVVVPQFQIIKHNPTGVITQDGRIFCF